MTRHFLGILSLIACFCTLPCWTTVHAADRTIASASAMSAATDSLPSYVMLFDNIDAFTEALGDEEMDDSLFNALSHGVIYKVNSTVLDTTAPVLGDLAARLDALADSGCMLRLIGIEYRAAASPEGGYANNQRLARGRAESFERFLAQHIDMSHIQSVKKRVTNEDYEYLAWLMAQAGDPDTEFVAEQIAKYTLGQPSKIKAALRAKDNGAMWVRILRDYYPKIRATRVMLYFQQVPRRVDATPEVAQPIPMATALREYRPEPTDIGVPPLVPIVRERPHLLSVSSNLLYDALYMPNYGMAPAVNIGVEYYPVPEGNWTVKAEFMFPYYHKWNQQKFFQIRDYHLEVRRYFDPGKLHTGWYLAAYINATKYGIGFNKDKGWEGEGAGAAIKAGYVLPLGNGRWRLDLHAAFGGWMTRYDPYVYGNPLMNGAVTGNNKEDYYYDWTDGPETFHKRNHRLTWFGPTEVGVTLSFDLLYRRRPLPGASFLRYGVLTP